MRHRLDELEVAASAARLPATGETAKVALGRSGPRGRGTHVHLPAFASDPRFDPDLPARLRRRIDRFSAVGYLAVRAVLSAVPEQQRPERTRIGVYLANTRAGWSYGEPELGLLVDGGPVAMHAYQATAWFPAAAQGEITIDLDLRGCAKTAAGRVSGFGEALWLARDALERGAVDLALAGSAESLVNAFVLRDWGPEMVLPSAGAAEGAVVFALRRPQAPGAVRLRDLRHTAGVDNADAHHHGDANHDCDGDWVPTLTAASRLRAAVQRAGDPKGTGAGGITVALGGGYQVTVTTASITPTASTTSTTPTASTTPPPADGRRSKERR